MTDTPTFEPPPQSTDLERRVLAHERILQSFIAYMARAEPRFLEHLRSVFLEPMQMARREQDFTDTDEYAEEFVRAIVALGEMHQAGDRGSRDRPLRGSSGRPGEALLAKSPAQRVWVRERNGIWTVSVDDTFWGDYLRREHAEAAAALARLVPT